MTQHTYRLKTALLAAASVTAAATLAAQAAPQPAYAPAAIEHAAPFADPAGAERAQAQTPATAKRFALWAAAAGVLAALIRLIGVKRLTAAAKAAVPLAAKAAKATAQASVKAVKYAARSIGAPVRFVLAAAALGFFALTGVGFYDVEWIGGLIVGAALTALVWFGTAKTAKALFSCRTRVRPARGAGAYTDN